MRIFFLHAMLLLGLFCSFSSHGADPSHKVVRVAYVHPGSPEGGVDMKHEVFWNRLRALGWEDGRNLQVVRRYAHGRMEAFPELMEEVVNQRVDLIVTTSTPGALAAKQATTEIPIVVHYMADPVGTGLVSSLSQPGGNLTGMSSQLGEGIPAKWLEILSEVVPKLSEVAVLSNPKNPFWRRIEQQISSAARTKGLKTVVIDVQDPNELEAGLLRGNKRTRAAIVLPDPMFVQRGDQVVAAMARARLPAMYGWAGFVAQGGLIAYGTDPAEGWEQAASYVDKILRGANAGDLPVAQPTKFQLNVNLKTAKTLGLHIPQSILVRADEVIR